MQVQVKLQHQLPFRSEAYLLTLHAPDNKKTSRSPPALGAAAQGTIPHTSTEVCIGEGHATRADNPQKTQSDPCLHGQHSYHPNTLSEASGIRDGHAGSMESSPAADEQSMLIVDGGMHEDDEKSVAESGGSMLAPAGSNAAARRLSAAMAGLQDEMGWRGTQNRALRDRPHKLQAWFGIGYFITLIPSSYSRRILNEQVQFMLDLPDFLPWCGERLSSWESDSSTSLKPQC